MSAIALHDLMAVASLLKLDAVSRLMLVDGAELAKGHVPPFAADSPALVTGVDNGEIAAGVKAVLSSVYPLSHGLKRVDAGGKVEDVLLRDLAERFSPVIYVVPLSVGASFEAFHEIVAHLRAPDGCPWDREQTHLSLRKDLLEESYETLAAMDEENPSRMREEFGDLLLQIVLNAQIGSDAGEFTMTDIVQGIYEKIVRRHPHVFGDWKVDGVGQVLSNWEQLKAAERKSEGLNEKGILDGLPVALPALNQAQEFQERAARVGFDWPEVENVLDKVREEIEEVKAASNPQELADELGDLFFVLVNLARWKKVNAEDALRGTNLKFKRRFKHIEKRVREMGKTMQEMTLEEMDGFWDEAKRMEKENRE
jgi:tetrapyrrole methylase family protein/MazG family protein